MTLFILGAMGFRVHIEVSDESMDSSAKTVKLIFSALWSLIIQPVYYGFLKTLNHLSKKNIYILNHCHFWES